MMNLFAGPASSIGDARNTTCDEDLADRVLRKLIQYFESTRPIIHTDVGDMDLGEPPREILSATKSPDVSVEKQKLLDVVESQNQAYNDYGWHLRSDQENMHSRIMAAVMEDRKQRRLSAGSPPVIPGLESKECYKIALDLIGYANAENERAMSRKTASGTSASGNRRSGQAPLTPHGQLLESLAFEADLQRAKFDDSYGEEMIRFLCDQWTAIATIRDSYEYSHGRLLSLCNDSEFDNKAATKALLSYLQIVRLIQTLSVNDNSQVDRASGHTESKTIY